ncbi:MAG: mechanosensitive ion channel [Candidatus Brocadiaceae bacterium]|nr:mechanosensitive ion channel [Candidatus Brocadiaceae bacterium]
MHCIRKRFSRYFAPALFFVWCVFPSSFFVDTHLQGDSSLTNEEKAKELPAKDSNKKVVNDKKEADSAFSQKEYIPPDEKFQTILSPAMTPDIDDLLGAETISKEIITEVINETVKRMGNISVEVKDDSPEGKIRSALKRRIELLKELFTTIESREKISGQRKSLTSKKEELEIKKREYEALGPVHLPAELTRETLELLQTKLDLNRNALSQIKEEANIRAKRIEKLPELQSRYIQQGVALEAAIQRISTELSVVTEGADREFLTLRLENAKLENRVVRESLQLLDNELRLEKGFALFRSEWIDYAQRVVTRSEEEYDIYQKALAGILAKEQKALKAEHEEKKQATGFAKTHSERFLATWEEKIAQINAFKVDLEAKKATLSSVIIQHEKRIQTEKDNFEFIKKLVSKLGTGGRGGERIKLAYQRIREMRRDPKKIFGPSVAESLAKNRARLFEIDEMIYVIAQTWNQQFESVLSTIPTDERPSFKKQARTLRENYRNALLEEQNLLTDVISQELKIQNLGIQLNEIVSDLEEFILPRLLWIRDAEAFGIKTPGYVLKEVVQIIGWIKGIFTKDMFDILAVKSQSPFTLFLGAIILLVLPFFLIYSRYKLKHFFLEESFSGEHTIANSLRILSLARYSVYLVCVAFLLQLMKLPESIGDMPAKLIFHFAIFLFLCKINLFFFSKKAVAVTHYTMRKETARLIRKSINFIASSYMVILTPSLILTGPPLSLQTIPRIGYTVFNVIALITLFRLIRKSSPLIQDLQEKKPSNKLYKLWTGFSGFTMLVLFSTIVMSSLGYRFGASWINLATLLSFFTIIIFNFIHQFLCSLARKVIRKRKNKITAAPGTQPQTTVYELEKEILSFIKMFFIVFGVFLFAVYWGINERVFTALDKIVLYTIHIVPPESVSVADTFKCIVIFVVTFWILKHLNGIFEISFFSRVKIDAGIRYAILTISRYGIFFIGSLIALSAIHLNFSQLGWLVAAMGFGLGFGMQEIFSNFVSGIILLVERPVRVGDIVKAGDVLGTVTRINIRATTVTNFERFENVIPNKEFITKTITNWTLADTITRLTIKVGVAYGSDIDMVRQILIDLANQQPEIMRDPAPFAIFLEHGDSALHFEVRFFVADVSLRMPLVDRMNTLINKEFTARGITIAYPQRDVHINIKDVQEIVKKTTQDLQKEQEHQK